MSLLSFEDFEAEQRRVWLQSVEEDRAETLFELGWTISMVKCSVPTVKTEKLKEIKETAKDRLPRTR